MNTKGYYRNSTLTGAALAKSKEERSVNWREWLDTFYLANNDTRLKMLQEEPPLCDPLWDALFAAGVSWLAHRMGIHAPSWTRKNCRRLRFPYWGAKDPTSDYAEYERDRAPAEFFNRNIYTRPHIDFQQDA